jgi:hypothetical protein
MSNHTLSPKCIEQNARGYRNEQTSGLLREQKEDRQLNCPSRTALRIREVDEGIWLVSFGITPIRTKPQLACAICSSHRPTLAAVVVKADCSNKAPRQ